jgi:hypothetical protein
MWAQRDPDPVDGREYFHFGDRQWVTRCYGGDVVPVELVEDPAGTYWGWDDVADGMTMVQPHHGMYTMQFAYGPEAEEERGNGRTVRLRVELLDAGSADPEMEG